MQLRGSKYFDRRQSPRSSGWDQKVKILFFQSIVMLHIKIFGITNAATYGNKPFSHRSLPRTWGGVKIQLFQNIVMVHFILKGITNATTW